MPLTVKELSAIEQQLNFELTLMKKYNVYSSICKDYQLKQKFEQISAEHQNHYIRLLNQLN